MIRRTFMIAAASSAILAVSLTAFAQQRSKYGTEEEAKAMLTKAIAAVKADKTKALDMFNKGEGGFADRDLYPFCFNKSDGTILAVSNQYSKQYLGKDVRSLTDAKGKVYGPELYAAASPMMLRGTKRCPFFVATVSSRVVVARLFDHLVGKGEE